MGKGKKPMNDTRGDLPSTSLGSSEPDEDLQEVSVEERVNIASIEGNKFTSLQDNPDVTEDEDELLQPNPATQNAMAENVIKGPSEQVQPIASLPQGEVFEVHEHSRRPNHLHSQLLKQQINKKTSNSKKKKRRSCWLPRPERKKLKSSA
ncbi:hypothetical protein U1Q18_017531 [Sarracenia purpurea var. burkii]